MNAPAGPPPLHEKDAPVLSLGAQGACWSLHPSRPCPLDSYAVCSEAAARKQSRKEVSRGLASDLGG